MKRYKVVISIFILSIAFGFLGPIHSGEAQKFIAPQKNGDQFLIRVSIATDGTEGNGASINPSISADGRYIVFESYASNLVAGDNNGYPDVFLHDLYTRETHLISKANDGTQGNNASYSPVISGDGRYVAFHSLASNLVEGDKNNIGDVFIRDLQTGETSLVTVLSSGELSNQYYGDSRTGGTVLSFSQSGRFITFESKASNLAPGDNNGGFDIFLRNIDSEETYLISKNGKGTVGNGRSFNPDISADGSYVAFYSDSDNFVEKGNDGEPDIFLKNVKNGNIKQVSFGIQRYFNWDDAIIRSYAPSVSKNGRFVAYQATEFGHVVGATKVFLYDTEKDLSTYIADGWSPSISDDGNSIAFYSWNNIPGVKTDSTDKNVYIYKTSTNDFELVSVNKGGVTGNSDSRNPEISSNGQYIVFESWADNLVEGDTNTPESYDFMSGKPYPGADIFVHCLHDCTQRLEIEDANPTPASQRNETLSLMVSKNFHPIQRIRGSVRLHNFKGGIVGNRQLLISLKQGEKVLGVQKEDIKKSGDDANQDIDFAFGHQEIGTYQIEAVLKARENSARKVSQTIQIRDEKELRLFDVEEQLTFVALSTMDELEEKSSDILVRGFIEGGTEAGSQLAKILFSSEFEEIATSTMQDVGGKDLYPDGAFSDVTNELITDLYELMPFIENMSSWNIVEKFVANKLSPERTNIQQRGDLFEDETMNVPFHWSDDYTSISKRWELIIENLLITKEYSGVQSGPPYFSERTYFNKEVRAFYQLVDLILPSLTIATLVFMVAGAIFLLISVVLTGGTTAPFVFGFIKGIFSFLVNVLSKGKTVGGLAAVVLAFVILNNGVIIVAPEIVGKHDQALDVLTFEVSKSVRQDSFLLPSQKSANELQESRQTYFVDDNLAGSTPVVETYIFNTVGQLVDIHINRPSFHIANPWSIQEEADRRSGEYRTVTVLHTKEQGRLNHLDPVRFTIPSPDVDLDVKLEKSQIQSGDAIHATIYVVNTDPAQSASFFLFAQSGGKHPESWPITLKSGEGKEILYHFVPTESGSLKVSTIGDLKAEKHAEAAYAVGVDSSVAINLDPDHIYDPAQNIVNEIQFSNVGNLKTDAQLSIQTYRIEASNNILHEEIHRVELSEHDTSIVRSTWLPSATPGHYVTEIYLDEKLHSSYFFDVRAEDTLFSRINTDQYIYSVGEEIVIDVIVENSAFQAMDPDEIAGDIITPMGTRETIRLNQVSRGVYQSKYTPSSEGTYVIKTHMGSSNKQVVDGKINITVSQSSELIPKVEGGLLSEQPSTINIIVQNEQGVQISGAGVLLSATNGNDYLHQLTDESGQARFDFIPEAVDSYKLVISKPGFAQTTGVMSLSKSTTDNKPGLIVEVPKIVNQPEVRITGKASPDTAVHINGIEVNTEQQGLFTSVISIDPGENLLSVSATDASGRQTKIEKTVIYDDKAPELVIGNPENGFFTEKETLMISGETTPGSSVIINDKVINVKENGSFETWVYLDPGKNTISIQALDEAGNNETIQRSGRRVTGVLKTIYNLSSRVCSCFPGILGGMLIFLSMVKLIPSVIRRKYSL